MVVIEVENSIKRYLLDNPEYLPKDSNFTDIDEFDILLADYFDVMTGVSCGSWVTGYLSSRGGEGAAGEVLENSRIIRRYGRILPGQAKGLEVFFKEYGPTFYPDGLNFNFTELLGALTPPPQVMNLTFAALANPATLTSLVPDIEIPGVNAPLYSAEGLEEALELFFGDVLLSDLSTYFVAHAYDLIRRQTLYFVHDTTPRRSVTFTSHGMIRNGPREFPEAEEDEEVDVEPDVNIQEKLDFYMKDVLRASGATPVFHEAKMLSPIDNENITYSLIDGMVVGNNPSLQTLILLSTEPRTIPITEIAMLSVGAGIAVQMVEQNVDASGLAWLANNAFLTIMMEGSSENIQSQVDFMFYGNPGVAPGQYLRVQVTQDTQEENGEAFTRVTEPEDLPIYESVGELMARRYRKAIDQFVADYMFT